MYQQRTFSSELRGCCLSYGDLVETANSFSIYSSITCITLQLAFLFITMHFGTFSNVHTHIHYLCVCVYFQVTFILLNNSPINYFSFIFESIIKSHHFPLSCLPLKTSQITPCSPTNSCPLFFCELLLYTCIYICITQCVHCYLHVYFQA